MGSSTVFCLIACLYGVDAKKEDIDSLQVLQNRAAQIVTGLPTRTNRKQMFQPICGLSVKQMIIYFSTLAVFKIRMSGAPAELAGIFRNESRTGRKTLSRAKINFFQRATNNWNTLPLDIGTIDSSSTG